MRKNLPEWTKAQRAIYLELAEIEERRRMLRRQLRALEGTVELARGIDAANEAEAVKADEAE